MFLRKQTLEKVKEGTTVRICIELDSSICIQVGDLKVKVLRPVLIL